MTAIDRVRVALVEDEAGTRARLCSAVAQSPALELVFTAATAGEIHAWLREGRPDVLLVDLGLPDGSGFEVIEWCRQLAPKAETMVITMFGDEANMIRAFEAGARGYLLKDGTEDDLSRHVLQLHAGGSPMSPIIARQLLTRMAPGTAAPIAAAAPAVASLSPRETEVLALVSRGYTYPELTSLLGVSLSTIQTHVKSIYSKLAVHSKTEAVFEARQLGLLDR
ncbi:response regulator [Variovorax sp. Varisp85]|jgi:DNA-binding NarL/FixJ family response regulator|uniref:response regulator transcription factor n=1 Tax=unclassified Variovorax TaxID=663243 RepID=UPI0002710A78|nr:response regulator transcription factor [Variovorax sp. CF313]EJL70406.1 response regulator containing a CheY-like receiver domain and an HTH DNA-binding domain [Variovorax sp. CF313]